MYIRTWRYHHGFARRRAFHDVTVGPCGQSKALPCLA
nr:MAG TPA: hypothetical protein [Microviridae sp.]